MGHVAEYISVPMNHSNGSIVEIIDIELCHLAPLDNMGKIQNGGYLQNEENSGDGTYGGNYSHGP